MADGITIDARPGHDRVARFLGHAQRRLASLADDDPARRGAEALGLAIDRARPLAYEPTRLPVLDSLGSLDTDEPLAAELAEVAPDLRWVPTPRADDGGTELALAPLNDLFDLGSTIVGLMYVGPGATYPLHHHPPQELYLTIAGTGRWRFGGNADFRPIGPDRTLYNHPGDPHSAIAGPTSPVVALYVLW